MRFFALLRMTIVASFIFPAAVFAAQVGFVPSSGLWFSRTDLKPGEMVYVHTVVVNNVHPALNGTVAFYDNDKVIGSTSFEGLKKDEAKQLRITWEPNEGAHRISARFTKAEAVDEAGKKTLLALETIIGTTGQALSLEGGTSGEVGSAALLVEEKNDRLLITPDKSVEEKKASLTGQVSEVAASTEEFFSKNNALLAKANSVAGTITSTAGKVEQAVAGVKVWIDEGGKWYDTGLKKAEAIKPALKHMYNGWLVISGDNDPKRIAIIVAVVLLSWFLVKRLRRREQFYDDL